MLVFIRKHYNIVMLQDTEAINNKATFRVYLLRDKMLTIWRSVSKVLL